MKPLNLDNRPCSPISSNCVIWQGPDIPCIKLCTGDTVSDVVYKLGTELCTIMDQLKVSNYDLSCLGVNSCPPSDFKALIQLLIDKICEANGITVDTTTKTAGCPDCVVTVAPCFIEGTTTTMQLVDYVNAIANRICSILSQIDAINAELVTINNTLVDLQYQIDNLPTYTLPEFAVDCILSPGVHALDVIVEALMNDASLGYCVLLGATGIPADINSAVLSQCILDGNQPLSALPAVNTFSAYYAGSWVNNLALTSEPTVANAIKNIWVAICDIYNYLSNGIPTTVVTAGQGITVTSSVLGNTTTYQVTNDYLETFVATCIINSTTQPVNGDIPKKVAAAVNGMQDSQIMFKFNSVASNNTVVSAAGTGWVTNGALPAISFGSFDNDTTGAFTVSDTGTYLIVATVQLKADNSFANFWQTTGIGTVGVGIQSNSANVFSGNYETVYENLHKQISITSSVTAYLPATTVVRMGVLNLSDRDYDGRAYTAGDVMRFSITKLR